MADTYSTTGDVEQRMTAATLAALTQQTPYDADAVDRRRSQAYALIRGHLAAKFDLSVDLPTETTDLLRETEIDLVEYSLWGGRREDRPKRVQKQRDDAMKMLDEIRAGTLILAGLTSASTRQQNAQVVGPKRKFTRESMEGMF